MKKRFNLITLFAVLFSLAGCAVEMDYSSSKTNSSSSKNSEKEPSSTGNSSINSTDIKSFKTLSIVNNALTASGWETSSETISGISVLVAIKFYDFLAVMFLNSKELADASFDTYKESAEMYGYLCKQDYNNIYYGTNMGLIAYESIVNNTQTNSSSINPISSLPNSGSNKPVSLAPLGVNLIDMSRVANLQCDSYYCNGDDATKGSWYASWEWWEAEYYFESYSNSVLIASSDSGYAGWYIQLNIPLDSLVGTFTLSYDVASYAYYTNPVEIQILDSSILDPNLRGEYALNPGSHSVGNTSSVYYSHTFTANINNPCYISFPLGGRGYVEYYYANLSLVRIA